MSKSEEPQFTVMDRRGVDSPKPPEPKPVTAADYRDPEDEWEEVSYMLAFMPQPPPNPPLAMGRAIGLRRDGKPFIADYLLTPGWPRHLDWPREAKKRLDTFLSCDCKETGPCALHKVYLAQWQEADVQRLNLFARQPMPKAFEILLRAEQARQAAKPNIIIPGRR